MNRIGRGIFDQEAKERRDLIDEEGDDGEVNREKDCQATTHDFSGV